MPVIIKKRLIPVEIKSAPVKKGSNVMKTKIKFLDENMKFVIGWNETDEYWKDKIQTISAYDSAKAYDTEWELTEWDGATKQKLITGVPVLPDPRA